MKIIDNASIWSTLKSETILMRWSLLIFRWRCGEGHKVEKEDKEKKTEGSENDADTSSSSSRVAMEEAVYL